MAFLQEEHHSSVEKHKLEKAYCTYSSCNLSPRMHNLRRVRMSPQYVPLFVFQTDLMYHVDQLGNAQGQFPPTEVSGSCMVPDTRARELFRLTIIAEYMPSLFYFP